MKFLLLNKGRLFTAIAIFMLASTYALTAQASEEFILYFVNPTKTDMTVVFSAGKCYGGTWSTGEKRTIRGHEKPLNKKDPWDGAESINTIKLWKDRGSRCNGNQGNFDITVSPVFGTGKDKVTFNYDSKTNMVLTQIANRHPGVLNRLPDGRNYKFTLAHAEVSKLIGQWVNVCSGSCDKKTTKQESGETMTKRQTYTKLSEVISTEVSAGMEYKGLSTGAKATTKRSKEQGRLFAQELKRGWSRTDEETTSFTPDQMEQFGFSSVWRWQVQVTLEPYGHTIHYPTTMITCTKGRRPDWLPLDKSDSCSGGLRGN